jgi:hypothetical protein
MRRDAQRSRALDALLSEAARALASFDPLAALKLVALRTDAQGLALRGIAMAQLGELAEARKLLARAARTFGEHAPLARARCITAEAEVALASRDLGASAGLESAAELLEAHGDHENALFARLQLVRRFVILGELAQAEAALDRLEPGPASPRLRTLAELVRADILRRRVRARAASDALERARAAARHAHIPALLAEVKSASEELDAPVARLLGAGPERLVDLAEVEALFESSALIVDACRREVRARTKLVSLVSRPVLFALARALAEAAPDSASRSTLMVRAFEARAVNDSLRARLRVEIGRLRRELGALARIGATPEGFALRALGARRVLVLVPPTPDEASALAALLAGGEAWSTSALCAALGTSQRTVQRALVTLEGAGRVRAVGRGRSRRWVSAPATDFATTLLLASHAPGV